MRARCTACGPQLRQASHTQAAAQAPAAGCQKLRARHLSTGCTHATAGSTASRPGVGVGSTSLGCKQGRQAGRDIKADCFERGKSSCVRQANQACAACTASPACAACMTWHSMYSRQAHLILCHLGVAQAQAPPEAAQRVPGVHVLQAVLRLDGRHHAGKVIPSALRQAGAGARAGAGRAGRRGMRQCSAAD
jgi:hypothetical protein